MDDPFQSDSARKAMTLLGGSREPLDLAQIAGPLRMTPLAAKAMLAGLVAAGKARKVSGGKYMTENQARVF